MRYNFNYILKKEAVNMDSEKELERRIALLESDDCKFPGRFNKGDYIFTAVVVLLCLAAVIGGAFL